MNGDVLTLRHMLDVGKRVCIDALVGLKLPHYLMSYPHQTYFSTLQVPLGT